MKLVPFFVALLRIFILTCVFSYVGIVAIAYLHQNAMLFPAGQEPDLAASANVPGLHSITLHTSDGLSLVAWYKPAAAGKPTLLYFHGNGGDLMDYMGRVRLFDTNGWGELFLEYRGYAGNPGVPSEDGLNRDALAAVAYLAAQGVVASHIVLYGHSLGTGVAVRLATEKQVGAVLLDSPYTSVADVAQSDFWFLPAKLLIRNKFALLSRIGDIHAPLLVMQGARDVVIPPTMGRMVFAKAKPPKAFWCGPDSAHYDVAETGGAQVAIAFVARYVPGA